jgi:dTDP-4-dehydrorhamnose reductase
MENKWWICGSTGMLGSHFVRTLKQQGISFIATDRNTVDITHPDIVSDFVRINKITHIVNCAAYTNVDGAEREQKTAYDINAKGPHNLAVAARRHGAKWLLHISTDYVFDGKNSNAPYTERDLCSPIGAYGASKLAGEIKLLDEFEHACIVRTSWLFGFPGKNFVNTILRLMKEKETLKIVSDQKGRPTYCQDLVNATLDLTDHKGIFHFSNSFETSWFHFANEIHKQATELGHKLMTKEIQPVTSAEYVTLAKRPAYSTLSTKKIEGALGKFPRPWQEALKDYMAHSNT